MRQVDKLIKQVRRQTENEDVGSNYGITEIEFIQYLNDAQERLQSLIVSEHQNVFTQEKIINVVRGTQEYALPEDCYMDNKVTTLEYSEDGLQENYYHLKASTLNRRTTYDIGGDPSSYIRRSGKILLQPTPDNAGTIRLNYIKSIDKLDVRRGRISSFTLNPQLANGNYTIAGLGLDIVTAEAPLDIDALQDDCDLSIVNKYGVRKVSVSYSAYTSSTGIVTVESEEFEANSGILDVEVGDYISIGKRSAVQSELPDMCERYLIAYASWKILKRDSSTDSAEQSAELQLMEQEIVKSFAEADSDIHTIPLINMEW